MSLGECLAVEQLLLEDPASRWVRLDTSPKHYFLINYSQAAGAASHEWEVHDLYFHTLLGPNPGGPTLITNCNQLISAILGGGMFAGLLVNIQHVIECRRRARVNTGEVSAYSSHVHQDTPPVYIETENEGANCD